MPARGGVVLVFRIVCNGVGWMVQASPALIGGLLAFAGPRDIIDPENENDVWGDVLLLLGPPYILRDRYRTYGVTQCLGVILCQRVTYPKARRTTIFLAWPNLSCDLERRAHFYSKGKQFSQRDVGWGEERATLLDLMKLKIVRLGEKITHLQQKKVVLST